MDKLSGLLSEDDFARIYSKMKAQREEMENKIQELKDRKKSQMSTEQMAKQLVRRFLDKDCESREVLVSLIERIELTENREIIIKFRFHELNDTENTVNSKVCAV